MSVANKGMFSVCLRLFPRSASILERVEHGVGFVFVGCFLQGILARVEDGGEAESSSFAALGGCLQSAQGECCLCLYQPLLRTPQLRFLSNLSTPQCAASCARRAPCPAPCSTPPSTTSSSC